jgi:hypothetical protein
MRELQLPAGAHFLFRLIHRATFSAQSKMSHHGNSDSDRHYDYVHRSIP